MASCLVPTALATTSPSRTLKTSAFTRPETRASPMPKLASTETTFRLPVTGSAVNRMPAACGKTICCTTTAMWTFRRSKPFRRRARSDGVRGLLAEPGERAGDRRRQIVRDDDPFEGPADLRAARANRLPVVRVQAGQPIQPILNRRRLLHDPPEAVRRHAKASRHADAFHPRKLSYVRALAAGDCDLRLVDLPETQQVAAHPFTFPFSPRRASRFSFAPL